MNYIFTSESVSDGHPDKVADQISDALVDAGLKNGDETTRVAIETLVTTNYVVLAGEVKNFNVTTEEVGNVAAFLCSDLASGVTGEITYVDGGMNITAAGSID